MVFKVKNCSSSTKIEDIISLENGCINRVTSFKYLGLKIDEKLEWREHVNYVQTKISPFVGMLKRIRPFITERVAMNLYYAHIHSRLIYCLPVWAFCTVDLKINLQRLQNKAVKVVTQKPRLTPSNELYDVHFLSFLQLCEYESLLLIHKIKLGQVRCEMSLMANEASQTRNTRQSKLLKLPNYSMAKTQHSLFYKGVQLYNKFCIETKPLNSMTIKDLKDSIKAYVNSDLD
jgi:hypothetical protein